MKRALAESKDLLNAAETIEHFNLSTRKFNALLKDGSDKDFLVFYRGRRLIIRTAFKRYLFAHPELRRRR